MNDSDAFEVGTPTGSASMTKAALVEEVARVAELTKKHSEVIVETVFHSIIEALHRGEKIELGVLAALGLGDVNRVKDAILRQVTELRCLPNVFRILNLARS